MCIPTSTFIYILNLHFAKFCSEHGPKSLAASGAFVRSHLLCAAKMLELEHYIGQCLCCPVVPARKNDQGQQARDQRQIGRCRRRHQNQ